MSRHHISIALAAACAIGAHSCKSVPGHVVEPDEMAEVLADIHTAEAVVEMRRNEYDTDSAKLALREAVYMRHGIDAATFDTSLVWYAHNMAKYIEVYDKTIEILERRNAQAGNVAAMEALSMAGDSVDIWAGATHLLLSKRLASPMVTFDISADDNWEKGDVYYWRLKAPTSETARFDWGITANYADSTVEYATLTTTARGWNEFTFIADTTRTLERLRGYVLPASGIENSAMWVDSITLVRKRFNPDIYNRRLRSRTYKEL